MIVYYLLAILAIYIVSTLIIHLLNVNKKRQLAKENSLFDDKSKHSIKNVCIIVAHPDDEVMFFGPIIRYMSSFKTNRMHVLCLTTGNYYGLGRTRTIEMKESCHHLIQSGFKWNIFEDLEIIDEPTLPDHPTAAWNKELCSKIISNYIGRKKIDILISFDEHGISSHPNHCVLNELLVRIKENSEFSSLKFFKLKTVNLFRKYMFLFDLIPTFMADIFLKDRKNSLTVVSSYHDFVITIKSMMKHRSQLVWFRWLYIL